MAKALCEYECVQGWEQYLSDQPAEFSDLPLVWERETPLPDWLRGSYIKNGPSQSRFGEEDRHYSQVQPDIRPEKRYNVLCSIWTAGGS